MRRIRLSAPPELSGDFCRGCRGRITRTVKGCSRRANKYGAPPRFEQIGRIGQTIIGLYETGTV